MAIKLLNKIPGNTIVSLTRVGLLLDGAHTALMDTLVFTLADGRKFELLTQQAETCFKEVSTLKGHNRGLFASFELEPDEVLVETCELNEETAIHLPITVKHITEIWANEGKDKFLVGIILSDSTGEALSICTESDDIELLSFDALPHRIKWTMRFYYQHIEYNNYSQKRSKRRPLVDTMPKNSQWARPPAVPVAVAVAHP